MGIVTPVSFLIVAGGGGGKGGPSAGSGGGAGGLISGTANLLASTVYTVTVGAGGTGGSTGSPGNNSSISSVGTATGGGGGVVNGTDGNSGGSGSGGSQAAHPGGAGTTGQGNAGGAGATSAAGGGGGAGAVGADASVNTGGNGGNGTASSITGASVTYAGGGGGSGDVTKGTGGTGGGGDGNTDGNSGAAGTANTGGGGGGGGGTGGGGGAGGSGVVILSVPTALYSGITTGSPTVTTSGANTILQFNASGSYTAGSGGIGSTDLDVQLWVIAVGKTNTTQAEVDILTTMVQGIKADLSISLLSSKFDRLWIYALGTAAAAAVDLVTRSSHTLVGSPTFTTQKGYQSTGVGNYINTGYNPVTGGVNYTQNAAHGSVYAQTGETTTGAFINYFGGAGGSVSDGITLGRNNTAMFGDCNHNSTTSLSAAHGGNLVGLWAIERSSASATALTKNGSAFASSGASTSAAPASVNHFVCALNNGGTPTTPTNAIIAATAWGVNGIATSGYSTRLKTALTAINATNFP